MRLGISHVTPHETPEQWAAEQRALGISAVVFPVDYTAPDSVIAEQPRGRKRRRARGRAAKMQRPAAPGGGAGGALLRQHRGGVRRQPLGRLPPRQLHPRGLRGHGRFHPRHPRRRPPDAHGLLHGGHAVDDPRYPAAVPRPDARREPPSPSTSTSPTGSTARARTFTTASSSTRYSICSARRCAAAT